MVGGEGSDLGSTTFDVRAISTALTAEVSPKQPDGQNGWSVHPARITIGALGGLPDGHSILYRVNQGSWMKHSGTIPIDTNGIHLVEYHSVDETEAAGMISS
ncbi:hypothetical protein [Paenibacillus sp. UNC451MF]|uniref:hypothetical protein n=1 Tax=Paenibacillus sp. UNC451MF TaxID=1449063 RepID=UPI00048A99EC|nr:hypothetical protein [Paenibacillus sp. UNC451MF]